MPIIKLPEYDQFTQVKGFFVGGCVSRGDGSRFRAKAHAHCRDGCDHQGWICILSTKRTSCKEIMLHEIAHIITKQGHTDKWRAKLLEIGGTLDPIKGISKSYHKTKRR